MRFISATLLFSAAALPVWAGDVPVLPPLLYLPVEDVKTVDPSGKSVLLPYERFIELWERSQPKNDPTEVELPDGTLTGWTGSGRITDAGIEADLILHVASAKPGWSTVVLRNFGAVAFRPPEGVLINPEPGNVTIHLPKAGRYQIPCTVVAAAVEHDGVRSTAIVVPDIDGTLSLSASDGQTRVTPPAGVLLLSQVTATGAQFRLAGLRGEKVLSWSRPVAEVKVEPLLIAQIDSVATISPRSVRLDVRAQVDVLRQDQDRLTLIIPPSMQVLAVTSDALKTWDRVGDRLELIFHRSVRGRVTASLTLESDMSVGSATVSVVPPTLLGAARQGGHLGFIAGEGVAVAPTPGEGWTQIDPAGVGLPTAVAAYRALSAPKPVTVAISALQPEIRANVNQLVKLDGEEDRLNWWGEVEVRRAGLFAFTLLVPEDWELIDTGGLTIDETKPGKVVDGVRPIELVLRGRALGMVQLTATFRRAPTLSREGTARATSIGAVRIKGTRSQRGLLGIILPPSWSGTVTHKDALSAPDSMRLSQAPWAASGRIEDGLAFAWMDGIATSTTSEGATTVPGLRMDVAPRPREVALRQTDQVDVEEATLTRRIEWTGSVLHRPLPAMRVTVPSTWDKVAFTGVSEAVPLGTADGVTTYELRFSAPVLGSISVGALWSGPIPPLVSGISATIALPVVTVLDSTRLQCFTAVARAGSLDVSVAMAGAEALNAGDLPAGLARAGVIAGFQSARPQPAVVTITRHDLVAQAQAGIGRVRQTVVVSADGLARIRSVVPLTSRGLPHVELRLPPKTTLLETTVDGRPARTSQHPDGRLLITIGQPGNHTVAMVCEQQLAGPLRGWRNGQVTLPTVGSSGVPVEGQAITLYLPADLAATAWADDSAPRGQAASTWADIVQRLVNRSVHTAQRSQDDGDRHGLTVAVEGSGRSYQIDRLGDGGVIGWTTAPRGWFDLIGLLTGAVALLAVWRWRARSDRLAVLAVIAGVALVATTGVWLAAAVGVAAGTFGGLGIVLGWRMWRGLRLFSAGRQAAAAERRATAQARLATAEAIPVDPMIGQGKS